MDAPYEVGDRVSADQLASWEYKGLSGKPGGENACRRYAKGQWILEVHAGVNPRARTRVVAIRTIEADSKHWRDARERQMRSKK